MYQISRHQDNRNILIVDLIDEYTLDDLIALNSDISRIAEESPNIYLILNTLKVTKFPKEIAKVSKLSKPIASAESIRGITIVNRNPIIKFISAIVTAMFNKDYVITDQLEVAIQNATDMLETV